VTTIPSKTETALTKATSIDQIEKSVLTANWPAIRDAIGQHLTEVSKKKLKKKKSTGK